MNNQETILTPQFGIMANQLKLVSKSFLVYVFFFFLQTTSAQINYSQNFTGCNANPCNNWIWSVPGGNITAVSTNGYTPCALVDPAARVGLSGTVTTASLSTLAVPLGISSGEFANFGFSYKVINETTGAATPANSCTFVVETAANPAGPYTNVQTFQNIASTDCVPFKSVKFFPPIGQPIFVRIRMTRNSGSFWAVIDNITLTQPAPSVVESTNCMCNNDQTPDLVNGTYSTNLTIRYADNGAMEPGLVYTLRSSTGLSNTSGGAIGMPTFIQCTGGCPSGVTMGEYYLPVQVQPGGMYSAMVDGPDPDNVADYTLGNTTCSNLYPALPNIPMMGVECLAGPTMFASNNSVYNIYYEDPVPTLFEGFSQTGTGPLTIDPDLINQTEQPYKIFLLNTANGCTSISSKDFEVYKLPDATLENKLFQCYNLGDSLSLTYLFTASTTGGGNFTVNGTALPPGRFKYKIDAPGCYTVKYDVDDGICPLQTDTKNFYITTSPRPQLELTSTATSPACVYVGDTTIVASRLSNGFNPILTITPAPATMPTGNIASGDVTITLSAPSNFASVIYNVCLEESAEIPAMLNCSGVTPPDSTCTVKVCKKFTVYNDGYECGKNNLFDNQCGEPYKPDPCEAEAIPSLSLGCGSFFTITLPDIFTSDVTPAQGVYFCTDSMICVDYNVSIFGLDLNSIGGGKTLSELVPGLSTICSVLNFCIKFKVPVINKTINLGCPLKGIAEVIGCDKTIAQFFLGILGKLLGGDGGGGVVVADTDGDGGFDYQLDDGPFPLSGTNVCIPNRVNGQGYITVRAVGGWPYAPIDVCGKLTPEGPNLLDLIPIGSIPIVGPPIEDALAALQCNVPLDFSSEGTVQIPVLNLSPPEFINCNEAGYVFAQTLDCDIPVNWSVPGALNSCDQMTLQYRGFIDAVDISNYGGSATLVPVLLDSAGIYQTAGPIPGSILPPGVYPVTYTAVSCNGNPAQCTFEVIVTTGEPMLQCPNSITVSTDVDQCVAVVNGLAPLQGIGCTSIINYSFTNPISGITVMTNSTLIGENNIPNGYPFELGVTTITDTMRVDINGDGDYTDLNETQFCDFSITVEDNQKPVAQCVDVTGQLDNMGMLEIFAVQTPNELYIDGGSFDNCSDDFTVKISRTTMGYADSVLFFCEDIGTKYVNLEVNDNNGNISYCKATVVVKDFFEDYTLDLDIPEICFEPFQDSIDFSPYLVIAQPDGTNLSHSQYPSIGPGVIGGFGISAFVQDPGSTNDPGTITQDGVYTIGTGTGFITISYVLAIGEQINEIDGDPLQGCYVIVHDVFRVQKLDPIWEGGFICCDAPLVWLGGASWDGIGAPTIPPGMISLTDVRGTYPGDVYGEWTGEGVSFVDPDGINYTGDEFYQFDPSGLDASVSLIYTIGDEPCIFTYSQEMLVTCQDLQIALSDTTVCPATAIDERVVIVNLDDDDLVVSTTGLAAAGGVDLTDEPVIDGRVVIPGFTTVAVRDQVFPITVTVYQTTDFGCADFFMYNIHVLDTIPPFFHNCPKEPIIVEALPNICRNFVNFEDPWADDNCFSLYNDIQQVDLTGLVSGDLYPVGTTILAYTATDTVGNQSYCELKIVVNDYEQFPVIVCASDTMAVNDPGNCSAIINDVAPTVTKDNCLTNNTITYEVKDKNGQVVYCGFEDASGEDFPVGKNSVTYTMIDQPLVLITEIVQDGVTTGIEVTNFGPAAMDLTCGKVSLKTAAGVVVEEFVIPTRNNKSTEAMQVDFPPLPVVWVLPNPNLIPVGGTWTYEFNTTIPVGVEAKYCFSFLDRLIDEVTINGIVDGAVILRKNVCDHDEETDFIPATPCDPGSFGMLNPGLPTMTDNGTQSSLQNYAPNVAMCTFTVQVDDIEAPRCIMHDSLTLIANLPAPLPFGGNICTVSDITIPAGIVNDVNIKNLLVTIADAGALTAYLNSPSGTRIKLFDGLCNGQANVDVTLDETDALLQSPSITTAPCAPLGQGGVYKPEESFKAFFGEPSGGIWQLELFTINNVTGTLDNWELEILNELLYTQQDTTLENDTLVCEAEFTWTHPVFRDNCCEGSMTVEYAFSNDVTGETSNEVVTLQTIDGLINIDGTEITKIFKVGVTVITYTLIDQYGNQSECGFVVTVLDTEKPRFPNGCRDWTIGLDGGECYGALPLIPAVEDNCAMDTITFCDENGAPIDIYYLPIGVNKITMKGIDIYGNVGICEFDVTIVEHVPSSNTITCNNNINVSLGPDCEAILTADMLLEGNDYRCYENYCITITDASGVVHANLFTIPDVGKTFTVTITDCLNNVLNSCWGYVNIEEKLIPIIECPRDTVLYCNVDPLAKNNAGKLRTGELKLLSCEPNAQITYQDHLTNNGSCSTNPRAEIKRRWRLDDNSGNVIYCDQIITFIPIDVNNIVWPSDFYGQESLSCADVDKDKTLIEPIKSGYPTLSGITLFGNNYCDIKLGYWDEKLLDINCGSGYTLLRNWTILNECFPLDPLTNPVRHIQRIDVDDKFAPIILPVVDVTVSTDPWTCRGQYRLPEIVHADDCSGYRIDWYSSYGQFSDTMIYNLLKGVTNVTAFVFDDCGNSAKTSFKITTLDRNAPVAIAKRDVVVSLSTGGPDGDGNAKLYTEAFNNGSFDNCTDVNVEVRRKDAPDCNNIGNIGHNNNNTYDNTGHIDDNINDTDEGQYVKFCCEDINAITVDANEDGVIDSLDRGYVQVFLRVWDDGNMSGLFGDVVQGQPDNFNETWTFVKVEDKLPPILACPDDATIYCDWGIDVSSDFGGGFQNSNQANFDKTGLAVAYGTCGGLDVFFNDNINVNDCGVGTIIRQWQASTLSKTGPKVVTCQQVITVLPRPTQFAITPPNPTPLKVGCSLTQSDLNKRLPSITSGSCDIVGENVKIDTFLFENGVCKKWVAEYNYTNWCTGQDLGPFYAYFIYEDTEAPVLADCMDKMYGVDANCEHVLTLSNSATDGGGCTDQGWLKWQMFVDTWADGTIGHYASSFVSASTYSNWKAVAGNDPILPAGHVYNSVVYVKYITPTQGGGVATVQITQEPISGPMSNHKVFWKVTDGCHNHTSCEYDVMVADKKAPTPYCSSLSTALMEDGSVTLWARDFDRGSFDNCDDGGDLMYTLNEEKGAFQDTIIKVGNRDYLVNASTPQYFDENGFVDFDGDGVTYPKAKSGTVTKYNNGDNQKWVPSYKSSAKVFDCDEYLAQGPNGSEVHMSVWDKKGNTDYCLIYLSLVDNQNVCNGITNRIAGEIKTQAGEHLSEVDVKLEANVNDLSRVVQTSGIYNFNFLPTGVDYAISAEKDKDYMNGVSTLDLVLIQRHILGLQPFTNMYNMVAADVNNDLRVRASDLVQLRKLILGVTNTLPDNTSWKLLDKNYAIDSSIPLDYKEVINVYNLINEFLNQDFVAVKVGDVNGSAKANIRSNTSEPRSGKTITLQAEEQVVVAGQTVSVAITSANYNEVFGYQFTTELNGLSFNGVRGGAIEMTEANVGVPKDGVVTVSYASESLATVSSNEVLFTLDFTAARNGTLSEMLHMTSGVTKAESYTGAELNVSDIELTFRTETATTANYTLYQNEPNPFKASTTVAYEMAEAGQATFTLYDVTGKVLVVKNEEAVKGLNTVEFTTNEIKASGIVYYQIESGDFTATKKMIIIE